MLTWCIIIRLKRWRALQKVSARASNKNIKNYSYDDLFVKPQNHGGYRRSFYGTLSHRQKQPVKVFIARIKCDPSTRFVRNYFIRSSSFLGAGGWLMRCAYKSLFRIVCSCVCDALTNNECDATDRRVHCNDDDGDHKNICGLLNEIFRVPSIFIQVVHRNAN